MQKLRKRILIALAIVICWNLSLQIGSIIRTHHYYLKIEVAGAVNKPGIYYFAPGSRVYEAIEDAGGANELADLDKINLAEKLKVGDKVVVPYFFNTTE